MDADRTIRSTSDTVEGIVPTLRIFVASLSRKEIFWQRAVVTDELFPTDISRRRDLRLAHPFKGGIASPIPKVPKGRLNYSRAILCPEQTVRIGADVGHWGAFGRPFGTYAMANSNPAVNCWAILESPSGRRRRPIGLNSGHPGAMEKWCSSAVELFH